MLYSQTHDVSTADVDSALRASGLDWRVQRVTPAIRPLGYVPGGPSSFQTLNDYRFLRRSDSGDVFACVSRKYSPHQNRDLFAAAFEQAARAGITRARLGYLKEGALVFAQFPLGTRTIGREHVATYMTYTTTHDGSGATSIGPSTTVIVCENTFALARKSGEKRTHRSPLLTWESFSDALTRTQDALVEYSQDCEHLAAVPVTDAQTARLAMAIAKPPTDVSGLLDYIVTHQDSVPTDDELNLVGRRIIDSILDAPGASPGSLWGVWQGVTHHADHIARSRNAATRAFSATYGPGAERKNRAFDLLTAYADAYDSRH